MTTDVVDPGNTPATPVVPPVPPVPVPPVPPKFDPTDPLSITWYVTAVLTVLGFLLKKDLTAYAGPVAMGIFALVGIAIGVVQGIKTHSFNLAMQQYNARRIEHWTTARLHPAPSRQR